MQKVEQESQSTTVFDMIDKVKSLPRGQEREELMIEVVELQAVMTAALTENMLDLEDELTGPEEEAA